VSKAVLSVPDISCGHCETTITKALSDEVGVNNVQVDVSGKSVAVEYDPGQISIQRIREIMDMEEYPVAAVQEQ
jgi:copper chaperone